MIYTQLSRCRTRVNKTHLHTALERTSKNKSCSVVLKCTKQLGEFKSKNSSHQVTRPAVLCCGLVASDVNALNVCTISYSRFAFSSFVVVFFDKYKNIVPSNQKQPGIIDNTRSLVFYFIVLFQLTFYHNNSGLTAIAKYPFTLKTLQVFYLLEHFVTPMSSNVSFNIPRTIMHCQHQSH